MPVDGWDRVFQLTEIGAHLKLSGEYVEAAGKAVAGENGAISLFDLSKRLAKDLEDSLGFEGAKSFASTTRGYCELLFNEDRTTWKVSEVWSIAIDMLALIVATESGRIKSVSSGRSGIEYTNDGKEEKLNLNGMEIKRDTDKPITRKAHKDL
jgi:hypothetical protein